MILESLKKILKRNCKNQGRNITLGMAVAFLLGSLGAYGADNNILVEWDGKEITLSGTIEGMSASGNTLTFGEDFVTDKQITLDEGAFGAGINIANNGKIEVKDTTPIAEEDFNNFGNGIGILSFYENEKNKNIVLNTIINRGEISGFVNGMEEDFYGYYANAGNGIGIWFYDEREEVPMARMVNNLTNENGVISGNAGAIYGGLLNSIGNGIGVYAHIPSFSYSDNQILGKVINKNGVISGTVGTISEVGYLNNFGNGFGFWITLYRFAANEIIDNLTNENGVINGITGKIMKMGKHSNAGNGIGISTLNNDCLTVKIINKLTNKNGVINGTVGDITAGYRSNIGNGIGIYSVASSNLIGTIENTGFINGFTGVMAENKYNENSNIGNGIGIYSMHDVYSKESSTVSINTLTNAGQISGYVVSDSGSENNAGNGVGVYSTEGTASITNFTNAGVITGKKYGVLVSGDVDSGIETYNNYGVIAGGEEAVNAEITDGKTVQDYGIAIKLDAADKVESALVGTAGTTGTTVNGWTVVNTLNEVETTNEADFNAYTSAATLKPTDKVILNGINNSLKVDKELTLTNSIINAYETAITISGENNFTLSGTEDNYSIINGDVKFEGNNNNITLDQGTVINGDIYGVENTADNTLTLGDGINIHSKIENIDNITVAGDVTLYEKITNPNANDERVTGAEITSAENIDITKDGVLNVRLGMAENGVVTNNALNNTGAVINAEGSGKLTFTLNGNGAGTIIELGSTTIGDTMDDRTESREFNIDAASVYHTVIKTDKNNQLEVAVAGELPLPPEPEDTDFADYEYLNKIYQSITSSKQDGILTGVLTDEEYVQSLQYFSDIFGANPYGYSAEITKRTMEMQEDAVLNKDLNPDLHKWAVYGGLTHIDGGTGHEFYGKGVTALDVGSRDIDAESKITGGYMLAEYKPAENLVLGLTAGGSSSDTDVLHSKVEGDAGYIGAYAKKYNGNLRTTLGTGFHYGDYEADRTAIRYWNGVTDTYSDNYNDMGFHIYGDVRYNLPLERDFFLEPHVTLSYTHIEQDGINEGSKQLAIETDDTDFDYTTLRTGVDLKKVIPAEKAKHTLSVGVAYDRVLDGYEDEYITGRFKGGSDFNILAAHKNKHSLSVNGKYAIELENGITADLRAEYTFERDTYHNGSKNKNDGEWTVGAGIGYKF